eukprot:c53399_g1_i1.p1 GENE.c53399_g1_i1~~c53399_g1_i1.p1  ORF type:complete len:559 (+),score=118.78 c53399_g1_i1:206-1882(+)
MIVGALVMLNMVIAVQVDIFGRLQVKQNEKTFTKERKTLMHIFYLAKGRDACIGLPRFRALCKAFNPKLADDIIEHLFYDKDQSGDGRIDVVEFFELCDSLRMEFTRIEPYEDLVDDHGILYRTVYHLTEHPPFIKFLIALVVFNTFAVCMVRASSPPWARGLLFGIDLLATLAYNLDLISHYLIKGAEWLVVFEHKVFAGIGGVSALSTLAFVILWISGACHVEILWIAASMRLLRIVAFFPSLANQARTLLLVGGILNDFCKLMGVLLYAFAVVGLELFYTTAKFNSVWNTWNTVLQMSTQEDWHGVMFETVEALGTRWASLYFVTFLVMVCIIVINLLMAIMYNLYVHQQKGQKSKKDKDGDKGDKPKEAKKPKEAGSSTPEKWPRVRRPSVVPGIKKVDTKNWRLSLYQTDDHRAGVDKMVNDAPNIFAPNNNSRVFNQNTQQKVIETVLRSRSRRKLREKNPQDDDDDTEHTGRLSLKQLSIHEDDGPVLSHLSKSASSQEHDEEHRAQNEIARSVSFEDKRSKVIAPDPLLESMQNRRGSDTSVQSTDSHNE